MRVMLRSDKSSDILIHINQDCAKSGIWESCSLELLDQHIRTLQTARKRLVAEQAKKETK